MQRAVKPPFSRSLYIEGDGLFMRPARRSDMRAWIALRAASRAELEPFEPRWPEDDLRPSGYKRRLKIWRREMRAGTGLPLLIFEDARDVHAAPTLVGGLRLANIYYGVQQSCSVGYWMGTPHAGRGLMVRALQGLIPFYFQDMGMHRLEAACVPYNEASKKVLERAGFQREGIARQFLLINGQWQDHLEFAIVRGDPASTVKL